MTMRAGIMYALAAAIGLGAITTQAKLVYIDGGNALTLMFWRFVMSIAIIGALIVVKRYSFKVTKSSLLPVIVLGFVWSGSMIFYLVSVETISVSIAVLILYSYPILVLIISMIDGRLAVSGKAIGVFVIAFAGIGLMLGGGHMILNPYGVLFAFLAASGATYTFLSASKLTTKVNPVVLTFWVNFMGIFLILPLVWGNFLMPRSGSGALLMGGATLCYIVAVLCQFQSLARLPAAKAAFIFNLEPVVSILLAVIFLGEKLSTIQWVGAGIVMVVLLGFTGLIEQQRKPM